MRSLSHTSERAHLCAGFLLIAALVLQVDAYAGTDPPADPDRPNVVVFFVDDVGYAELRDDFEDRIPTPNIDRIAEQGVRFTNGYVTSSYCGPSRAGLMTGRYQMRFGFEFNPTLAINSRPEVGFSTSEITLGDVLREAGYSTGAVGKWHLGASDYMHPMRRGFDEFYGFLHEGHFYVPPPYEGVTTWLRRASLPDGSQGRWTSADGSLIYSTYFQRNEPAYDADNPIMRGGQPVQESEYLTDAITRESVDFIDRNKDRPFLLYVAYNAVHSPLQGAEAYMDRFADIDDVQRQIFAAMLSNLDDGIGAVMQKLRDEGLEENTIVFFISDNGGPTEELTSNNAPLRGGKGDMYEGGVRVPFLMQWKGTLPAGQTEHRPVISLDVLPTVAAAAGADVPNDRTIDGVDLLPYLNGQNDGRPHESLFWRQGNKTAVRFGDWKLVENSQRDVSPDRWELYNLADDIGEQHNLASERPDKFREVYAEWTRLDSQMAEPLWHPSELRDPYARPSD